MKFPKPASRVHDTAYLLAVKRLPCMAPGAPDGCRGGVEADHTGSRGIGRKADDDTCIPLCAGHHADRGAFRGPFRGADRAWMRLWIDQAVRRVRAELAKRGELPPWA